MVYVLMNTAVANYFDNGQSCVVFDTLEKAQKQMQKEFDESQKEWLDIIGESVFLSNITDTTAYHTSNEDWSRYHCDWEIQECEVY